MDMPQRDSTSIFARPNRSIGMNTKSILTTLVLAILVSASSLAVAADKKQTERPAANMPGMEKMDMNHGMMGGMMGGGMMEMMQGCKQMMGGAMMPELPAGNEKLQVQMRAEMMQKMGEILGRYADRIKDEKGGAR